MKVKIYFWIGIVSLMNAVHAGEKRPMTLVDRLEIPGVTAPRLSPSGNQLLFVWTKADWKANRRIGHIWRIGIDGTGLIQMTNGDKGERNPRWSPDGRFIAFLANRGESKETQIFLIRNEGGEAWQLTHHDTSVNQIAWAVDGSAVYFLADDPETKQEKKRKKDKDDIFGFNEDYNQRHLWRVSVADKKASRLTQGDFSVVRYHLGANGSQVVYHRAATPILDDWAFSEIWVLEADGGHRRITENPTPESGARLSPDGARILFLADVNENFEYYYNRNLFVVPAAGGTPRLLLPDLSYDIRSAEWSADGKSIFLLANLGVRIELFRLDPDSEQLQQLTDGKHTLSQWHYQPRNGHHVFGVQGPTDAGDVWLLENGAERPRQLTHVFDYLETEFLLPHQEAIQWRGADGVMVEGLLTYPIAYEAGKTWPLVVQTHGGPRGSDRFGLGRWRVYIPTLAAKGYAVLAPNYRGSTGYGDAFLRDMVGGYFRQSHLDVMTGVDHLIEQDIADPERLVKMGWSAGGHMTIKIITHTHRFKAASAGAGAVNWISMYGQSDTRLQRTPWFGGTPWQKDAPLDVYWEHSPIKDMWKVTTPTLVLVGRNDLRVPAAQSLELFRALKANGVPTHLYMAPREAHGWRELRHQLFKMNVELAWFEKHAMGREYKWEKPPETKEDTKDVKEE